MLLARCGSARLALSMAGGVCSRGLINALGTEIPRMTHTHERQQSILKHRQADTRQIEITVRNELKQLCPVRYGDNHGEEKQLQLCDVDELGVGELVTLKHVGNARKSDAAAAVEDALTIAVDLGWTLLESPGCSLHHLGLAFRLLAFFVGVQKRRTHKDAVLIPSNAQICQSIPMASG